MTESALSLTYPTIAARLGDFAGIGPDSTLWITADLNRVNHAIDIGYRDFLQAHDWRFGWTSATFSIWQDDIAAIVSGTPVYNAGTGLSTITATTSAFYPTMVGKTFVFTVAATSYTIAGYTSATVITVTGNASAEGSGKAFTVSTPDNAFNLPDDFGSPRGPFSYDTSYGYAPIPLMGEGQLRSLHSGRTGTGHPLAAAIRPKSNAGTDGQRWEVIFYPNTDAVYTLGLAYNILTDTQLRTATPYPLGGMWHSNTIMAAIYAAWERLYNREAGLMNAEYQKCLAMSIRRDVDMAPDYLGYNRDRSDAVALGSYDTGDNLTVTVNGVAQW